MKRYRNFNRFLKRKTLSIRRAYCQGFLYHLPIAFPGLIPFEDCHDLVVGSYSANNRGVKNLEGLLPILSKVA
jgi:gamma-glutamylcyclotransferase (GGCT)/AIG2-like uncharacterized protein YtfP